MYVCLHIICSIFDGKACLCAIARIFNHICLHANMTRRLLCMYNDDERRLAHFLPFSFLSMHNALSVKI